MGDRRRDERRRSYRHGRSRPRRRPNPIELGAPCPDPHLVIGTVHSDDARLVRFDPASRTTCRTSPLLEFAPDYGHAIRDVEWHRDTGLVLGTDDGILGIGPDGFPAWRFALFNYSQFDGDLVFTWGEGAATRIGVFWSDGTSSIDRALFLDRNGNLVSTDNIEPPFFMRVGAGHPDGTARFIGSSLAGENFVYDLPDSVTEFEDTRDGTPLFAPDPNLSSAFGNRAHLATDLVVGAMAMTHLNGVLRWTAGAPAPTSAHTCGMCTSYVAAVIGPGNTLYAICHSATSERLVVQLDGGSACSLLIDGSGFGSHTISDLTLVHSTL